MFFASNQHYHTYEHTINKHRSFESPTLLAPRATTNAVQHPAPPPFALSDHQSSRCEQPHSPSHDELQAPATVQSQRKRTREQKHAQEMEHPLSHGGRSLRQRVTEASTVESLHGISPSTSSSSSEEEGWEESDCFEGPFVRMDYHCGPYDQEE